MFADFVLRLQVLLGCCLSALAAFSQPKCKISHYTTEDGLSHDNVTCMIKDSEGFMWFGTWAGINRFDGHNFVSYKSHPGDMSKLKNDRIDEITEDRAGYLWLLAYDKQVYRFDKKTEQFLPLSEIIKEKDAQKLDFDKIVSNEKRAVWLLTHDRGIFYIPNTGLAIPSYIRYGNNQDKDHWLPSDRIVFFHEDKLHQVWIGTPNGIIKFSRDGAGNYKTSNDNPFLNASKNLSYTDVAEDDFNVYFCTAQGYLITLNKAADTATVQKISNDALANLCVSKRKPAIYCSTAAGTVLSVSKPGLKVTLTACNAHEAIHSIYEDSKGCLWIEPSASGIIRFDPATAQLNKFSQKNDANYSFGNEHMKVFEDNNGIVWANMKGGGFGYYSPLQNTLNYFYNGPDAATHRFSNMVNSQFYDEAGILWLSTGERGIIKIIFQGDYFNLHPLVGNTAFRSDNEVRGIYADRKNRLWLGVKSSKLYVLENGKPVNGLFINMPPEGLGSVYSILQDRTGTVWLGTKLNGLFRAEPTDNTETKYKLSHYTANESDINSLSGNDIYALEEDKAGHIWVGTFGNGLNEAVIQNQQVTFINEKNSLSQYPQKLFHKIRHITCDQHNRLWIATTSGLLIMDAEKHSSNGYRFKSYSKIPGDEKSIGSNDIQFILPDAQHTMWMATSGGGLCQALGNDPFTSIQFKNYTLAEGLPSDYILSMCEDNRHNLWLATQNGLSKFNLQQRQFTNYDSDDGLQKADFSEASSTKTQNGSLVFGTVKGYLMFKPDEIADKKTDTRMAFTNLQVNNQNRISGNNDGILKTNINYAGSLELRYDQNNISVDYTVLDYSSGNKQDYAYRLMGLDTVWHNNQLQRRVTYTNLSPGRYTLEITSLNNGIYDSKNSKTLEINILPPPWRTWWAYLLYVAFAVLIFEIVRRNALTVLKLRQRVAIEHQMAELKVNFFTNISHELRTPLTLILNPIEHIAAKEQLSDTGKAHVDIVRKNANRMIRFINQLLDLRKAQSGKATLHLSNTEIIGFIKNICTYFNDLAHEKNIAIEITSNVNELFAVIDPEKIETVIYNLLSNALKFSPNGKKICIHIHQENNSFTIAVKDEGEGVPEKKLSDIFELYYEGQQQFAKNIKGTGIGLALSKELIELHQGKIWAENNPLQGLTVKIQLQSGREEMYKNEIPAVDQSALPTLPPTILQPILPPAKERAAPTMEDSQLVLLVEDNLDLQFFLKNQLSEFFRVEVAANGKDGLQKIQDLLPDLIISDIMMPIMNGIEMLVEVKNNISTSHIPFVLLSAQLSIESQIEGIKHGADLYITKPFNNEFLMAAVKSLLNKRKKLFQSLVEKDERVELKPSEINITPRDETFLKQVIEMVESGMGEPGFSIETVAENMHMGRSTFYKKFKSLTDIAPVEFIRDMRLKRGMQYLDAGETNISTIAYNVGFNNARYFSTCFKEKFKVSPTEYLKNKPQP